MSNCAVVQLDDNIVVNMIVATVDDLPPDGCYLIACDGMPCDIGWIWDGDEFVNQDRLGVPNGN
jgi:hypothetical protein